jgi:polyhydroxybutyrate depolymerase
VYPNGYGFLGLLRHWNAGHCCGRGRRLGLDDVGFLDSVLDDVARRVDIDPGRVYVVGESNGAMLAYLYASVRSDRVAGVGAVIGTIGSAAVDGPVAHVPVPENPVPVVIVHGTADASIPFHGGPSDGKESPVWSSVSESARFWVRHNGARADPKTATLHEGQVEKTFWAGDENGRADGATAPVVLYVLAGWPHEWPGPGSMHVLEEGDPLRGFDAARVLWHDLRGFRRQHRDGSP